MEKMFTFNDVLIKPQYSEVLSRRDVDLSTKLGCVSLKLPIISANMKTITGPDMAKRMSEEGGLGILHRFGHDLQDDISEFIKLSTSYPKVGVSIGVQEEDKKRFTELYNFGARIFCLDVAHGHHILTKKMLEWINNNLFLWSRDERGKTCIIAGNIATPEAYIDLSNWGADICKVGIGPGCFAKGTRILMSNGIYKNIEDIKKDDIIINMNGKCVKVKNLFNKGYRKINSIRHNNFYKELICTSDHNFYIGDLSSTSIETINKKSFKSLLDVNTKQNISKFKWKEIEKCNNSNYVLTFPKNIDFDIQNTFSINLKNYAMRSHKGYDKILNDTYNLGYIFGTFLGDGNSSLTKKNSSGRVSWYFGKNEQNIVEKLSKALYDTFNKSPKINYKSNIIEIILYNKPLAKFFDQFGKSKNKHLPCKYISLNKNYLSGIIDGLIDSDGCEDNNTKFTNTSPYLMELLYICNYICNKSYMGFTKPFFSNTKIIKNEKKLNESYKSYISSSINKRTSKEYYIVNPLDYNSSDIFVETFDIEVDDETHSFIANNVIVHNSSCRTRKNTGVGYPQLSALKDVYNVRYDKENCERIIPIIADGGMSSVGDISKALKYSDAVMLGLMLSGTSETPGKVYKNDQGQYYKFYAGSASGETKESNGQIVEYVEGISKTVPFRGSVKYILKEIRDGLQSAFSYVGARNLQEFKNNAEFMFISDGARVESSL